MDNGGDGDIMADHAEDGDIYVYRGGHAPQHVTHVIIDKSVDEIEARAFFNCKRLVKVETHDGIRKIGKFAFDRCTLLSRIDLKSVVEICASAFCGCENLAHVEFGDKLETIGDNAFWNCTLEHLKLPSIITIEFGAFMDCDLIDIELSERLETIGTIAFWSCERLQRIAIPLKRDIFVINDVLLQYTQFHQCEHLVTVDLVGGIHKNVASLHMESWRTDMLTEINRINQVLPTTHANEKADLIRQWMGSVIDKMDQYEAEHCRYVVEATSLLELALWKTNLAGKEESAAEARTKKAQIDAESVRKEKRIICGADMVVKNVLPFLQLE